MAGGSATKALRERIARMEEMLGEWPCEDVTVALWVEHSVREIQGGTLQSYGEDIAVLKKFFKAAHVPDSEKVSITSLYLTSDAKLWWRTRIEGDAESGKPQITTWETLKNELKDQFIPTNKTWVARESLKGLRHTGSMRDYMELRRQGVRDLLIAMVATDCLVDYKMGGTISTIQKPKLEGDRKAKCHGLSRFLSSLRCSRLGSLRSCSRQLLKNGSSYYSRKPLQVLGSSLAWLGSDLGDDKGKSDSETPSRVNPLQLLNVIHGETHVQKSLMHVHVIVNSVQVKATVDSGATHNFVDTREVAKLGLKLEEDTIKERTEVGQDTYVATLIEIKEGKSVEVPDSMVKILKEFKDVMLALLPKELPPQQPIDHKIELLPGTKLPTQAPYRMSHAKLLELRKRLKEKLDAS
ncbi:hypothetical protein CK203_082283 [Vitis vinifera]|uniref:Retrotransposon gag domain-containing protein n=1 Tax=Vitis vinifera TaxID=29760 RepID=A0A438EQG8_VITVI|nr:hypothetical protein CK203_082283 [Vitis vinifera]